MKLGALMDGASAEALRAGWLAAELEPVSDYGRRIFEVLEPFAAGDEAAAADRAGAIAHVAHMLETSRVDALRETLRGAPDATGAIARAGMGDALTDVQFLELIRFCDAVERVRALLDGTEAAAPPACADVARILERGRSGKFGFYLGDAFDGELAAARAALHAAQAEYDAALGRLRARIARTLQRADVGAGEFILMRDEMNGPLPAGLHVIREAPTYYLCEIELDEGALAVLGRRDDAAARVAELEQIVRADLSSRIREHATVLEEAARALGSADVLAAAVRFTQHYACVPATYATGATLAFEGAHFLPLQSDLERQGRGYVPISMELRGTAVVTGPNMGGKSVALRTCGFLALCAAFGLPVPARNATVPLFSRVVWLGIGPHEEPGSFLSSFAGEVVRLRDTLQRGVDGALLLVDEFARTTTPEEGRALLLALIERLRQKDVCAFVATHLSGIATDAKVAHYAVRGLRAAPEPEPSSDPEAALDALARSMDYTLERVGADSESSADAIFLARLLGLDGELIESARQWIP